jgi:antitoxin component of MazEF toxin-antitoxin module
VIGLVPPSGGLAATFIARFFVSWTNIGCFVQRNWGNLATVWGLYLSFYVLVVATDVKRAIANSRALMTRRSLTETLTEALHQSTELGNHAQAGSALAVRLRAQDILVKCQSATARWGNEPGSEMPLDKLLNASGIAQSLADEASKVIGRELNTAEKKRFTTAQLALTSALSQVVAKCQEIHDRE